MVVCLLKELSVFLKESRKTPSYQIISNNFLPMISARIFTYRTGSEFYKLCSFTALLASIKTMQSTMRWAIGAMPFMEKPKVNPKGEGH